MADGDAPVVIVHLDESCLGNGRDGRTPGGAGALVEVRTAQGIQRRDVALAEPDTTNNRMALAGAERVLTLLAAKGRRLRVLCVSDSEYLVKGMREWVPGWQARGWRRPGGAIENLELWQALVAAARQHDAQWTWVRGHKGHPKNEFVNDLAIHAATTQAAAGTLVPSTWDTWLAAERAKKRYLAYDADEAFTVLEEKVASGREVALRLLG